MSFHALRASALLAAGVIAVSGGARAQTDHHIAPKAALTITLDGTLGPIISGTDPAGLDGQSATVTVTASESLKPYKTTAHSASYHIPAGAIIVDFGGTDYTSSTKSSMVITLGKKADTVTFQGTLDYEGFKVQISDVSSLAAGSWTKSVLRHPMLFSPSPQNLTEPSSNFTYTAIGETTELGVTGTVGSSGGAGSSKQQSG